MADKKETTKTKEVKVEEYTKTICKYDGREIPIGEGGKLTEEEIQTLLSSTFPELANADYDTEIKEGVRCIEFIKKAGTKGSSSIAITDRLNMLKPAENLNTIACNALLVQDTDFVRAGKTIEEISAKIEKKLKNNFSLMTRIKALTPKISNSNIEGI